MSATVVRTIIADDEAPARERIRELLEDLGHYRVVAECATGPETVQAVLTESPEVLFLDVQMPGLDGLTALREVPAERRPAVVLATAYDRYAVAAFDLHAVDYLLKPYSDERFADALGRVERHLRGDRLLAWADQRPEPLATGQLAIATGSAGACRGPSARMYAGNVLVRDQGCVRVVPVGEIDYLEASGDYVHVHARRHRHVVRETLRELEGRLDPEAFVRIHRSYVVRIDRIRELQPFFGGDYVAILNDGTRLRISRACRAAVERAIGARVR